MSFAADIEERIRDTTGQQEISSEQPAPPFAELESCSCGHAPICTEGSAALLKKCAACFADLEKGLLDDNASVGSADQLNDDAGNFNSLIADPVAPLLLPEVTGSPLPEPMPAEAIEGALMLATTDSRKACVIALNGTDETFIYVHDPVNGTKHRKLFKRMSWDENFALLYWYTAFGAICTKETFIVTPCVIGLKNYAEGTVVLYAVMETMCHRPRYDGLCVNIRSGEVFFVQNIVSRVVNTVLSATFDRDELDRFRLF